MAKCKSVFLHSWFIPLSINLNVLYTGIPFHLSKLWISGEKFQVDLRYTLDIRWYKMQGCLSIIFLNHSQIPMEGIWDIFQSFLGQKGWEFGEQVSLGASYAESWEISTQNFRRNTSTFPFIYFSILIPLKEKREGGWVKSARWRQVSCLHSRKQDVGC